MIDFNCYFDDIFRKKFDCTYEKIIIDKLVKFPHKFKDDKMILHRGESTNGSSLHTIYQIDVYNEKEQLRNMGLLLLYQVFSYSLRSVEIRLKNPNSEIKTLIIKKPYYIQEMHREIVSEYYTKVSSFEFKKTEIIYNTLWPSDLNSKNLPIFNVSNKKECISDPKRDVLRIEGSDNAFILLADLLLNMSLDGNTCHQIALFHHGTGHGSDYVRFIFPSDVCWLYRIL